MTVEQIIVELARAWNASDAAAWADCFSEDADFVDVVGRVQRGRAVIAREHQKIFDTIYRGSRVEFRQLSSRDLGDLVLLHTASILRVPSGPRAGETHSVQTMVLTGDGIRAFHNTIRTDLATFAERDDDLAGLSPLDWTRQPPAPSSV